MIETLMLTASRVLTFEQQQHMTNAWKLLGVHSSRLDVGTRDLQLDEALGLNCTWYADILLTLTAI